MVSIKGGENMRLWLWVWEKATGRLTKLSDQSLNWSYFYDQNFITFLWIDNRRLVTQLVPDNKLLDIDNGQVAIGAMIRELPDALSGREPTGSVLTSGKPVDLDSRPQHQITVLDINGGAQPLGSAAAA